MPLGMGAMNDSGSDLLSHQVTLAVPSALEDLTTEFGMGSGVAPPLQPPEIEKLNRTVQYFEQMNAERHLRCGHSMIKPHGRLVQLSSMRYRTSTCCLSTS